MDNYRRILEIVGEVAGDMIAPNAEQIDREGNTLNEDGTVTLHPLVRAEPQAARPGRPDGLHPAAEVRRAELPQPGLHDGQRDRQPGRLLADEPLRPAGHRRDDLRLRQRRRSRTSTCRASARAR